MIYVIFFAYTSIAVSLLFRSNSSLIACIAVSVFLATFAALRGSDVASDFTVYEDWYINRDLGAGLLERPGLFEYLYFLLSDIFSVNGIPFRIFIWLLAFMAVFIKTKVIASFAQSGRAVGVSVLIYTFTFYLLHEFTQIRAGVAIAFIFLAVHALVGGSRTHFALLVVLAAGFHSSAVMALLLLLPYQGSRARWVDWGLLVITGILMALATLGIAVGMTFFDVLAKFDPRIALYISLADSGQSEAANPFAVPALLLLALALSLFDVESNRGKISNSEAMSPLNAEILAVAGKNEFSAIRESKVSTFNDDIANSDERHIYAMVLVRRNILMGLIFLASLSPIPELALRLFEMNIAFLPILAAIIFSQPGWVWQKCLLLLWACAVAFIYIVRDEGLVQPYVLFFS